MTRTGDAISTGMSTGAACGTRKGYLIPASRTTSGCPAALRPLRRTAVAACLIAALLPSAGSRADPAAAAPDLWFPVGETLTYRLYWGPLPVGEAQSSTRWEEEDGQKRLVIRFTARSNRVVEKIYPVDIRIESVVDPVRFLPLRLVKQTSEGSHIGDDRLSLDQDRGVAKWEDFHGNRVSEYPIAPGTHDFVSFMFDLRRHSLETGKTIAYPIAHEDRTQSVSITVGNRDLVRLPGQGAVPSLLLNLSGETADLFVRKVPGEVWVSDDARRVVTIMYLTVPVGRVKCLLVETPEAADDSPPASGRGAKTGSRAP